MTDCEALRERMVTVAHRRSGWSPAEAAHLAGCEDCMAEFRLITAAGELGRELAVDPTRIESVVLPRLRTEPVRPIAGRRTWYLGLAAAALLVLAVWSRPPREDSPRPAAAVLSELDGLTAAELESVLETVGPTVPSPATEEPAPLEDLTPAELERVLRSLEG